MASDEKAGRRPSAGSPADEKWHARSDVLAAEGDANEPAEDVEFESRDPGAGDASVEYHPNDSIAGDRATLSEDAVAETQNPYATASTFEAQTQTRDHSHFPGSVHDDEREKAVREKGSIKGSPLPEDQGRRG